MQILIKPFDTLFFRDGKPFEMGEENIANTQILPNPETIWGAILSTYLYQNPKEYRNLEQLKSKLKINFISLARENKDKLELLFNFPLDIVKLKDKGKKVKLQFIYRNSCISSINTKTFLSIDGDEFFDNLGGLINETKFINYLERYTHRIFNIKNFYTVERKVGIGLDSETNSIVEGRIYRTSLIRLFLNENEEKKENIGIFVDFEGLNLENEGFLKLGGENKVAYYKEVNKSLYEIKNVSFNLKDKKYFKIILLTPAIPRKYFLPDKFYYSYINNEYIDIATNQNKKIKVKLVNMILPKNRQIGGFDLEKMSKNKSPIKHMYKVIPEGSILYFETDEKDLENIKEAFHLKSISDINQNKGFGICVVGNCQN